MFISTKGICCFGVCTECNIFLLCAMILHLVIKIVTLYYLESCVILKDISKPQLICFVYISWIALAKERIFWQVSVIMVRNLAVSRLHGVSCI
jgi:hypothetical protein